MHKNKQLILIFLGGLILTCGLIFLYYQNLTFKSNHFKISQSCIKCHKKLNPGLFYDWQKSKHAMAQVGCYSCHQVIKKENSIVLKNHLNHSKYLITTIVTPKSCQKCHVQAYEQYQKSKHANTIEILNHPDIIHQNELANHIEQVTGCYQCHGSTIETKNGIPVPGCWPNVGVGRINPDGSRGSCTSCHTRHKFSIAEARKPEACMQCHLGPDHPQIEIYQESKHGAIYSAEGKNWDFDPSDKNWTAGRDYRTPTCASCHISQVGIVLSKSHDVTKRLAWELQAQTPVHPQAFKPFPADTKWEEERYNMTMVCMQCHSLTWRKAFFENYENAIQNYLHHYLFPAQQMMDELYKKNIISADDKLDDKIEWKFYELLHFKGRRALMGSAMMAPDYAWWHGFYELKKDSLTLKNMNDLLNANLKKENRTNGKYNKKKSLSK